MHMADALVSATVGGSMAAVSTGTLGYSLKVGAKRIEDRKIPLMGVMGAFVFSAQMINFTIPGTGSSGHIGGGILLAILLGPQAAFITIASVLTIQALFFGDGGLLALGCNVFNMGFITCYVAYPLLVKPLLQRAISKRRIIAGSILGAVIGLQLGAFSVVLETQLSGITSLPFIDFVLLMQPIHLAIGLVEGVITAAVICALYDVRPELLSTSGKEGKGLSFGKTILVIGTVAVIIGGVVSQVASSNPDGLEWAITKVTGSAELDSNEEIHDQAAKVQETTAILPDYNLKDSQSQGGTSIAGIVGVIITIGVVVATGTGMIAIRKRKRSANVKGINE
ncbi:MAG TPA: energy-coupling factor ABC transporter permease [Lachnospiraceae bacterium]|nr:energy-coupling factor ABC transporter permease [Lachnospiraceae bacterium]